MRKAFAGLTALAILAALLLPITPAGAQSSFRFWAQVVDELGRPITSGVTCQVYTAGSDTRSTIYSDTQLATAAANPLTGDSAGQCSWYMSASTAVDLIVWHKRGRVRFDAFTIYEHKVVLDSQGVTKVVRVPFTNTSGSKTQTGVTIPKGAILRDVLIELVNAVHKAHIAIGIDAGETGGDDDGFCGGSSTKVGGEAFGRALNDAGWLRCHATLASSTVGVGGHDYYVSGFHSGLLISRGAAGSAAGHAGSYMRFPFIGDGTAKTVVYTTTSSNVAGHFYLIFDELGND